MSQTNNYLIHAPPNPANDAPNHPNPAHAATADPPNAAVTAIEDYMEGGNGEADDDAAIAAIIQDAINAAVDAAEAKPPAPKPRCLVSPTRRQQPAAQPPPQQPQQRRTFSHTETSV